MKTIFTRFKNGDKIVVEAFVVCTITVIMCVIFLIKILN